MFDDVDATAIYYNVNAEILTKETKEQETDPCPLYETRNSCTQTSRKSEKKVQIGKSMTKVFYHNKSRGKYEKKKPGANASSLAKLAEGMLSELSRPTNSAKYNTSNEYCQDMRRGINSKQSIEKKVKHIVSLQWNACGNINLKSKGARFQPDHFEIMDMTWNSSGSLLIVVYGSKIITKKSSKFPYNDGGVMVVWDLADIEKNIREDNHGNFAVCTLNQPNMVSKYDSSLVCLTAHPKNPYLFAAGSIYGEILLFNYSERTEWLASPARWSGKGTYFHEDKVSSLCWKYSSYDRDWLLCSVGIDGKVLFWYSSSKHKYPVKGSLLQTSEALVQNKRTKSSPTCGTLLSGTALSTIDKYGDENDIYIGSEIGQIVKLRGSIRTTALLQTVKEKTKLKWSSNALLSIAYVSSEHLIHTINTIEEKAKLYKRRGVDMEIVYEAKIPLHIVYPCSIISSFEHHEGAITCIDTSPFDGSIFLSCGMNGEVRLYSTVQSRPRLVFEPSLTKSSLLNQAIGSPLLSGKFSFTKPTVSEIDSIRNTQWFVFKF